MMTLALFVVHIVVTILDPLVIAAALASAIAFRNMGHVIGVSAVAGACLGLLAGALAGHTTAPAILRVILATMAAAAIFYGLKRLSKRPRAAG
jgi:hypothetical protein